MNVVSQFRQVELSGFSVRTYGFCLLFIAGNILLPQLCHLIPDGGKILLPIYFFTLIAGYKFGLKAGLLTAVLSPLCNYLLFGMPSLAVLPVLLVKSSFLAIAAAWVSGKTAKLSLLHVALVVLVYQVAGGFAEWGLTGEWSMALRDFRLGYPGMLLQVSVGWLVLRWLSEYE